MQYKLLIIFSIILTLFLFANFFLVALRKKSARSNMDAVSTEEVCQGCDSTDEGKVIERLALIVNLPKEQVGKMTLVEYVSYFEFEEFGYEALEDEINFVKEDLITNRTIWDLLNSDPAQH